MTDSQNDWRERLQFSRDLAISASEIGSRYFRDLDQLTIESKGHQDMVSQADREVEVAIRKALGKHYPDDAIVGEEYPAESGTSEFSWVIDPIDGTANFVRGLPVWATVIACVTPTDTVSGVIHDPNVNETFTAIRGEGAWLNDKPLATATSVSLADGSVGIGYAPRSATHEASAAVTELLDQGGMFFRNASGALMLAYVAAGRLIGYCEPHMNAWDCLAGMLMIEEAGGRVKPFDPATVLQTGCQVVTGAPGVFGALMNLTDKAFDPPGT